MKYIPKHFVCLVNKKQDINHILPLINYRTIIRFKLHISQIKIKDILGVTSSTLTNSKEHQVLFF